MTRQMLSELARIARNDSTGVYTGSHPENCYTPDMAYWSCVDCYERPDSEWLRKLCRRLERVASGSPQPLRRLSRPGKLKDRMVRAAATIMAVALASGCAGYTETYSVDESHPWAPYVHAAAENWNAGVGYVAFAPDPDGPPVLFDHKPGQVGMGGYEYHGGSFLQVHDERIGTIHIDLTTPDRADCVITMAAHEMGHRLLGISHAPVGSGSVMVVSGWTCGTMPSAEDVRRVHAGEAW